MARGKQLFCKNLAVPAIFAGATMLLSGAALAQARPDAPKPASAVSENALEEVIVTARRREESLQVVPISVTAFSGETLASKGIANAFDLQSQVPSLRIQASELSPRLFTTSIRGLKSLSY